MTDRPELNGFNVEAPESDKASGHMERARTFLELIVHRDPPYKDAPALYAKTVGSRKADPTD